ncbi:MAG: hypothetical protein OEU25_21785, partial [Rhodospirillales bacterium]|nr:hypothetical protein [Rhodospirillales bacterium]
SQFQGFCRDLHSEAVDHVVTHFSGGNGASASLLRANLVWGRRLDRGNPNPGNLGSDFNRLGIDFWDQVKSAHAWSQRRKDRLEMLNEWRNAIAHQDFSNVRQPLHLNDVRAWRTACNGLARTFDRVLSRHLTAIVGAQPW